MHRTSPGLKYSVITLTQVSFLAGTVHLLSAINSEHSAPKKAAIALAACVQCEEALDEMVWKCAAQSAEILRRLRAEWCGKASPSGGSSGLKRGRPADDDYEAPRDLHRSLWDSSWGRSDAFGASSLPSLDDWSQPSSGTVTPNVSRLIKESLPYSPSVLNRSSTSTSPSRRRRFLSLLSSLRPPSAEVNHRRCSLPFRNRRLDGLSPATSPQWHLCLPQSTSRSHRAVSRTPS